MTRLPIVDYKTMEKILLRLGFASVAESYLTFSARLCT